MQVESTDFHVHRNVMASVSPHLMELFSAEQVSETSELQTNNRLTTLCLSLVFAANAKGGNRRGHPELHAERRDDQGGDADPHRLRLHFLPRGSRCTRQGRLLGRLEAAHGGGGERVRSSFDYRTDSGFVH